jgi:2-oxoglutarate ferredoxin oxidoreductase subunit alpha
MGEDVFTFLLGGKAGEGIKKTGAVAGSLSAGMGRHLFRMDDYQSLIKGGHNFTVVSSAIGPIKSHYRKADVVVALDRRSYQEHAEDMSKRGILIYNSDEITGVRE